jgi:uncharacterized lipoprotein YmbA
MERSELITRKGDCKLRIHEGDLWSEPLDSAISRVMAENLRRLTDSTNIQPSGNFITRDYSSLLEIRIERFDPQPDGSMLLECTWRIQPVDGPDASPRVFQTTVPVSGAPQSKDLSARITAMNEALARLARAISRQL